MRGVFCLAERNRFLLRLLWNHAARCPWSRTMPRDDHSRALRATNVASASVS